MTDERDPWPIIAVVGFIIIALVIVFVMEAVMT